MAAPAAGARAAADLCREAADGLGAATAHRAHRARALDDLQGAGAQQAVAAAATDARTAVFDYIETFYNPLRLHSTLDYLSPVDYERMNEEKEEAA